MTVTDETIDETASNVFREAFRGAVLRDGDEGYDEARTVWNAMIDRYPALIARPTGAADVMTAVDFARENDVLLSVKGSGHNVAGKAVADGGLMLDLSEVNDVRVDPEARTARVGPGATLADLDHETQAFELATPGGVISMTGVAGLTLGGGFGWLSRKYGLTVDNLRSVDVVTADGQLRRASEERNEDLFWGIRGGGGNFGVVTSFEFDLHEVGPEVLWGLIVYPYENAPDVIRNYRDFVADAPNECSVFVDNLTAPPLPFIPEEFHGEKVVAVLPFYAGDLEEGEAVIEPLRTFGEPIADTVGPHPFTAVQSALDDLHVEGARNYWKPLHFTELADGAIDTLVESVPNFPTPQSDVIFFHLGGVVNEVPSDATAYPHRDTTWVMNTHARWEDPSMDEECIEWARGFADEMAEYATGDAYVNFLSDPDERIQAAFGDNYDRLVELKNEYDPANLFRVNQNVEPTG